MRIHSLALAGLAAVVSAGQLAGHAVAQSHGPRGQGAIVIAADAPVFKNKSGEEIVYRLKRGDAVAGYMGGVMVPVTWMFVEDEGRARVAYFQAGKNIDRAGWMRMADLAVFTYDGSCDGPKAVSGSFKVMWNPCFQEARDAKLEQLRAQWAAAEQKPADPNVPAAADPNQSPPL